jgi:hypothetical protein
MAAKAQTATAQDSYDSRVELMGRAFSEIAKLCFWADYSLDQEDWAALDSARLDPLPYDELRSRLRETYLRIQRKAQSRR